MAKYYMAYGSNLNKQQMALRCRDAKPVCTGVLHDYRLKFRRGYSNYPIAVLP